MHPYLSLEEAFTNTNGLIGTYFSLNKELQPYVSAYLLGNTHQRRVQNKSSGGATSQTQMSNRWHFFEGRSGVMSYLARTVLFSLLVSDAKHNNYTKKCFKFLANKRKCWRGRKSPISLQGTVVTLYSEHSVVRKHRTALWVAPDVRDTYFMEVRTEIMHTVLIVFRAIIHLYRLIK